MFSTYTPQKAFPFSYHAMLSWESNIFSSGKSKPGSRPGISNLRYGVDVASLPKPHLNRWKRPVIILHAVSLGEYRRWSLIPSKFREIIWCTCLSMKTEPMGCPKNDQIAISRLNLGYPFCDGFTFHLSKLFKSGWFTQWWYQLQDIYVLFLKLDSLLLVSGAELSYRSPTTRITDNQGITLLYWDVESAATVQAKYGWRPKNLVMLISCIDCSCLRFGKSNWDMVSRCLSTDGPFE